MLIRDATEADGPVLAEIERRAPMIVRGRKITTDRGDHYFAFARLMEESTFILAEVDGQVVGVMGGSLHRARIEGNEYRMSYAHHLRVLPDFQRQGVWRQLRDPFWERYPVGDRIDSAYSYVARDNERMQEGYKNVTYKWPSGPVRALISCEALAGPSVGRSATPDDAEFIVEMLNSFNGNQEMYLPYSVASLFAKLERDSKQYSWDRILLSDHALFGVWPAGDTIRVVVETDEDRTESRRGLVLDYAYARGAELEFEKLIRAQASWGVERGLTDLSIMTHKNSPGYELISRLAHRLEPFDFWTHQIQVPQKATETGLYVDQIYF